MNKNVLGEAPQLDMRDYQDFSDFLRGSCGIELGANKQYLVATRIRRILLEYRLGGLAELTAAIKEDNPRGLRQRVLDAMTTNETFWFRDAYPFDYLANNLLPELYRFKLLDNKAAGGVVNNARPPEKIKVWSAACSSGQEPYSISIIVEEALRNRFGNRSYDVDILATDLSSAVLDVAREGIYDRLSLARGLSAERAASFFKKMDGETWQVKDSVRQRVRFRALNLQDSFVLLGKFDVIFCRNVLIYFSSELKLDILRKLHGCLNPGGVLFLGSSESITGLADLYEMINCKPGIAYRARPAR